MKALQKVASASACIRDSFAIFSAAFARSASRPEELEEGEGLEEGLPPELEVAVAGVDAEGAGVAEESLLCFSLSALSLLPPKPNSPRAAEDAWKARAEAAGAMEQAANAGAGAGAAIATEALRMHAAAPMRPRSEAAERPARAARDIV